LKKRSKKLLLWGRPGSFGMVSDWPGAPSKSKVFCFFFSKKKRFLESFLSFRDRLLANPSFQTFAARFPPTRGIARREARALFDICAGFVYAQTLSACVALDLFETLAAGPLPPATLAARCRMSEPAMRTLLDAAVSLRLLARSGADYRLGPLGAALRGNPGIPAMVNHHRLFYADLADPVALLRGETDTALAKFWPYHGAPGDPAGYSALMAASQPMIAAEIFAAHDFSRHLCILDVCGGDGTFLARLAPRAPAARLMLFDLPDVAAQATRRFAEAGLASRATAYPGDIAADALPAGADLITLIRVLHDNDDNRALHILAAARAALGPGGKVLVAEPMSGTAGAEPIGAAYFGFYLLAMRSGRPRSAAELTQLLVKSGFRNVRQPKTGQPMLTGILTAEV
jgi:demethylspheroidene O-methyltransferase